MNRVDINFDIVTIGWILIALFAIVAAIAMYRALNPK